MRRIAMNREQKPPGHHSPGERAFTTVGGMSVSADTYGLAVARLRGQYAAIPTGSPVRLAKRTSNLFRARTATDTPGLDVSDFDGVLSIDPVARTADVLGMTTYEHLVDATLEHGL